MCITTYKYVKQIYTLITFLLEQQKKKHNILAYSFDDMNQIYNLAFLYIQNHSIISCLISCEY